jgi:hypothetical protein
VLLVVCTVVDEVTAVEEVVVVVGRVDVVLAAEVLVVGAVDEDELLLVVDTGDEDEVVVTAVLLVEVLLVEVPLVDVVLLVVVVVTLDRSPNPSTVTCEVRIVRAAKRPCSLACSSMLSRAFGAQTRASTSAPREMRATPPCTTKSMPVCVCPGIMPTRPPGPIARSPDTKTSDALSPRIRACRLTCALQKT